MKDNKFTPQEVENANHYVLGNGSVAISLNKCSNNEDGNSGVIGLMKLKSNFEIGQDVVNETDSHDEKERITFIHVLSLESLEVLQKVINDIREHLTNPEFSEPNSSDIK